MLLFAGEETEELTLTFGLEPGKHADAVATAEAIIAWAAAIREANAAIDPGSDIVLQLISAEEGSLRLRAALRFIENHILAKPADALSEFPRIKKLVVATVLGLPAGAVLAGAAYLLTPAETKLSPEGQKRYEEAQAKADNPAVRSKVQSFYKTVTQDGAITSVTVSESRNSPPLVVVPRAEFHDRAGVWQLQEQGDHERPRKDVWDVVVTHPAMKGTALVWKFERDGLPFSAKMSDQSFLAAIKAGTLDMTVQEGVQMRVEIEWTEHLHGQNWEADPRTRRITRVVSPRPRIARGSRSLQLD